MPVVCAMANTAVYVHDELLLAVQEGAEATRTSHSINVVVIQSVSSSVAATGGATQYARHGRNWLARSAPLPTIGALCLWLAGPVTFILNSLVIMSKKSD